MVSESSEFSAVPAEVTDAGRFVQLTAESLVSGLQSVGADIEVLLESWTGTSADAYSAGWTETKHGADTVLEALSAMAEMLGVTSQALQDHDQARAEQTSSLELP
ncbi:WXG100 family type VII secretion target [Nocardia brasiliensis]|uniref:WXG100 family type VII secretion target n=1 Tax=Nocardia brasiliensis TaxID=37326 RepID=UPI003D922329